MNMSGNTILITGGGSGIGRGLAEAFHQRGNQVIIAGRTEERLQSVTRSNPGMASLVIDVADSDRVKAVAERVTADFPTLNMLINNAGIQHLDDPSGRVEDEMLTAMVATNLLGPIRLTSALIDHLRKQPRSAIINVTSMLGYLPLAYAAAYSATKAALHSWTMSQRYRLRGSPVAVIEIAPPVVQTGLLADNEPSNPLAMPLADFVSETMSLLESGNEEALVERARSRRDSLLTDELAAVTSFNDRLSKIFN